MRIELLGTVACRRTDGSLAQLPGRRTAALLGYLALEGGRAHPRATLARLLWPDVEPGAGRAALRQSLHGLRRACDALDAAVETDAVSIRLVGDALEVDALALEDAARAASPDLLRDLLEAWRGPLLGDLACFGTEHRTWLARRRQAFESTLASASLDLVRSDLAAERWDDALATALLVLERQPRSGRAALGAMHAYLGAGERAEALHLYDSWADRLRALGEPVPCSEIERLADTLRPDAVPGERSAAETAVRPALLLGVRVPEALPAGSRERALGRAATRAEGAGARRIRSEPDRTLFAFGGTELRSDDVERALRAAAAIAIPPGGAEADAPIAAALVAARLHADENGVPRPGADDAARAIRLAGEATPGRVLVDGATRRMAGAERMRFGPAGPPDVWHLLGEAPSARRTPFIGRDLELTMLEAVRAAVREQNGAHVALLVGEPGIGKTRLAVEALELAAGCGMGAWRIAPARPGTEAEGGLLRRIAETVAPDRSAVPANEGEGGPRARAAFRRAWMVQRLRAARRDAPVTLLIDQAETIVEPDLNDLAALVRDAIAEPILWLVAGRHDGLWSDTLGARLAGRLPLLRLDLAPLAPASAFRLAEAQGSAGPWRAAAIDRARGNPLFLEQLLMQESEAVAGQLPPSILAAIQARLETLPLPARAALRAMAVLGQDAAPSLLARIGDVGVEIVGDLVERGLLVETDRGVSIAHPLIGEGVLGSMAAADKRALHGAAAREIGAADPAGRAHHLCEADHPDAGAACLEAAEAALGSGRMAEAVALAERGLGTAPRGALRSALALAHGRALLGLGEPELALEAFETAAFTAVDRRRRAEARIACASAHRVLDRTADGLAALEEARTRLGPADHALRAEWHIQSGRFLFVLGDAEATAAEQERALVEARAAGDDALAAAALGGLADADYARGRMVDAMAHVRESIGIAGAVGAQSVVVAQESLRPHLELYLGRAGPALATAHVATERAQAIGAWRAEINARLAIAASAFMLGQVTACRDACDDVLTIVERSGARRFAAVARLYLARLELIGGRPEAAAAQIAQARDVSDVTGQAVHAAQIAALTACAASDEATRSKAIDEAVDLIARGALIHNHLRVFPNIAWILLRHGDHGAALRAVDRLAESAPREQCPWAALYADALRALAHADRPSTAASRSAAVAAGFNALVAGLDTFGGRYAPCVIA